ncbi:MAG: HlyD family efflux transporter periplasmic adaptor subunit [Bacteroidales bacterium]|nr:HlyD family efflux transporter periplasmic adaptor subunit [Bacteroidales bacterium]
MDIPIEKKKGIRPKHIYISIALLLFLFLIFEAFFATNKSTYRVAFQKISIDTVHEGIFHDYISVTGNLEPIATIYLDALEGGRVEEKLIEEGSIVKKGDIILKLSNPDLDLSILNSEAQLAEKSNFLRNTMVVMEQEKLRIKRELLNLEFDIKRKKRKYEQNKVLYQSALISKEDFLVSEEDYQFAQQSYKLYLERQKQDSIYRSIQVKQMKMSLHNMDLNLQLVRKRKENLNVKAPVNGQLSSLDVELGQSVPKGNRIGKIDVLTSFKVVAKIDEHYIDKVRPGLIALLKRNGKEYKLKIRKVLPDVKNGQFTVEMIFISDKPENMRTGQTYYTRLQLGNPKTALLLPRGSFFQKTGGQWIFVLSLDGKTAEKRNIKIGKQNPRYYEVVSGLNASDVVVTSGYDNFGENEQLEFK